MGKPVVGEFRVKRIRVERGPPVFVNEMTWLSNNCFHVNDHTCKELTENGPKKGRRKGGGCIPRLGRIFPGMQRQRPAVVHCVPYIFET